MKRPYFLTRLRGRESRAQAVEGGDLTVDWRLRRAMGKKVGREVNVKGKGLTPEMTPETITRAPHFYPDYVGIGLQGM